MTDTEIIEEILEAEQWNGPHFLDKGDRGGRTAWGISEVAHPDAWKNGPPSREEAAAIYREEYVTPWTWVPDAQLRFLLTDWLVNSSPRSVNIALQRAVGADDDGAIGPQTRALVLRAIEDGQAPQIFKKMLVARAEHFMHLALDEKEFQQLVKDRDLQIRFLRGWLRNRVLKFI